jgi:hypothetical protein
VAETAEIRIDRYERERERERERGRDEKDESGREKMERCCQIVNSNHV